MRLDVLRGHRQVEVLGLLQDALDDPLVVVLAPVRAVGEGFDLLVELADVDDQGRGLDRDQGHHQQHDHAHQAPDRHVAALEPPPRHGASSDSELLTHPNTSQ
jgi:hypothetical protein